MCHADCGLCWDGRVDVRSVWCFMMIGHALISKVAGKEQILGRSGGAGVTFE